MLEVGPGRGALTDYLVRRHERVIAIEFDAELAAGLAGRHPNLTVIHRDVLQADLSAWGPVTLAGNLPYYITSPILERIFRHRAAISEAVILIQREVADRLAAGPDSRDYGYLSVLTQVYSEPKYVMTVKPGAFQPPPKVDSAVVHLRVRQDVAGAEPFLGFVSMCFRQKRKTLRNNLASQYAIDGLPEAGLRAEQLSVPQLLDLYGRLRQPSAQESAPTKL